MQVIMEFSESLKKNKDFKAVYNSRRSRANRMLIMYVMKNGTEKNRLGISVSKKVGNSVVRHRITRLIRESYRLHEQMFNSGLDMAVVARQAARDADYHRIEYALLQLAGKAGIYDKKRHD
jgi:ribonuclease P protein component